MTKKKTKLAGIAGISGLLVGLYMLFILKDMRGTIPASMGIALLLLKF